MNRIAFIITAAAAAFFAQPAQAAPDATDGQPVRIVRIDDLDLAKSEDQDQMVATVERAARRLCAAEPTRQRRRQCVTETVDYALNKVSPSTRRAYAAASDRRASFAVAAN